MSQTSFTADGMSQTSKRFNQGVANVKNARTVLAKQMDELAKEWGGQASQTFNKVMTDWGQQHDIIIQQLQDIADKLGTGANKTAEVEHTATQNVNFFQHGA